MARQIAKLYCNGEWKVIKDDKDKVNPYRVYNVWYEPGEYGCVARRKQVAKYDDLASCMYHLYKVVS